MIHAEPALTQDGHFLNKYVTFRIIKEEANPRNQLVEEIFTREQVSRLNMSLSDNRLIKLNLIKNELIDIKLIFESVHKKHQFAELLNLTGDIKNGSTGEESKESQLHPGKDLKMLNMTWNMG